MSDLSLPNDADDVTGDGGGTRGPTSKRTLRALRVLVVFLVIITTMLGGLRFVISPSPYVELSSGPVVGLNGKAGGSISLTTVDSQRLSWGGYIIAKIGGQGPNIIPYSEVSLEGSAAQNAQAMKVAKTDAAIVAVYAVTGRMPAKYYGATITYTLSGMPASRSKVRPGDTILTVNGVHPGSIGNVAKLIQLTNGGPVRLGLLRGAEHLFVIVKPKWVVKSKDWKIGVGLTAVTHIDYSKLPKALSTGAIEGPSGGLMFTLAYITELSPGALARVPIAGTGTIDTNGGVGDIGGVGYKVSGAVAAGDKVFFVPYANAAAARRAAKGRIQIVVVNSVGDALHWLCTHGATNRVCRSPGLFLRLKLLLRPAE